MVEAPSSLRAVLFDLDGVLVDSFEAWFALVNEVARRFESPAVSRRRLRACFGQGIEEDARLLFAGRTAFEIQAAYDEGMGRHLSRIRANPEARSVLDALAARRVGCAVATNTQATLAGRILATVGLADAVQVVAALDGRLREKPEPDLVLFALEGLGVAPERALLVGDTDYDARAARRAGVAFLQYDLATGTSLRAALRPVLGAVAGGD